MVSAARATRRRTPGRLVHLPVDEGGLLDDARLLHLEPEVGALTGALADPGEHRDAAVVGGDPVDHLLDEHGLAHAGPAEQADLAALHVGLEQVDDLDAGLEHDRPGLERVEGRARRRWISQSVLGLADGVGVERLAEHVEDVAEHGVAHRDLQAVAQVADHSAPGEAVGWLEADAPHPAVADLLGDLGGDHDRVVPSSWTSTSTARVDLGQGVRGELHVDDGAGDGDHPPGGQGLGLGGLGGGGGHERLAPLGRRRACGSVWW